MCEELLLLDFMEQDGKEKQERRRKRRKMRQSFNPISEFDDAEFIKRYRLSKKLFINLCDEMRPLFRKPLKSTDLTVEEKMITTLAFYATGSYQKSIGVNSALSIAQQTASAVIKEVTACIDSPAMREKYISFPQTIEEQNITQKRFEEKFKMKGVLGCIACTHIGIVKPFTDEKKYYCPKKYYSLNVQLICDADLQITSVDASHGGATQDSSIWNVHPIKTYIENLGEETYLLGDSAYPLQKHIMTPVLNTVPGTPESYYTEIHIQTRNVIKKTIGLLKTRFRCLGHRALHYQPKVAASITSACVILHNICVRANISVPELIDEDLLEDQQQELDTDDIEDASQEGVDVRNKLIAHLVRDRLI